MIAEKEGCVRFIFGDFEEWKQMGVNEQINDWGRFFFYSGVSVQLSLPSLSNLSLSPYAKRLIQLRLAALRGKSGMFYFWLVLSFLPSHSDCDPYNQASLNILDHESKSFGLYKKEEETNLMDIFILDAFYCFVKSLFSFHVLNLMYL